MEETLDVPFTRAGVAGLGLIGGSLALALRQAGLSVTGYDIDTATVRAANTADIAASTTPDALFDTDILFIALYPDATIDFVRTHAARIKQGGLVVDCCGIKTRVVEALTTVAAENGFTFIGGHPMAGSEFGGFGAARADLFAGASFLLTPPDPQMPQLAPLETLLRRIGCVPNVTDPAHHDRMIAFTSQLPHALACAYVLSSSCPGHAGFSAGSYRDVSRVAHINPTLWAELFLENRDAFCAEMDEMIDHLQTLRNAAAADNRKSLEDLLKKARKRKELDNLQQR
ncbi:prephenate dehydrogenase [Ethanoligenens harbinense]|uniref:prephenate dehydrogenase n=1 Tax=Ethanoligenens harbinense TaxID=253239 RepID=UPI0002E21AEF|nr:prephenate dehydrogenase [Ethanoligenens harbinense]AVQ97153.1 prephenate dehydrogenase/arogenate dehydrogenase family protein [Ethanoligenens harbinense YUAN-3]AYF39816.1 prephenate dehydrogenase/arogenate dehydrogenase family protein [Ethanoligenens harbinense]AYF42648.1 prephenate dehydrogenase/arogenate dehydrogenase family protein [Ethanoligenens harbinense]QCN93397.1 prephenate dehydrogenase/arogenate dehydrogenase family protein [Ethanoligenens harbinense]